MPTGANSEALVLRTRAHHLRGLATQLIACSVGDLSRRAGDEVWRGPLADRCRDELVAARRRLDVAADELRHHALVLDRRADEADLRAAAITAISSTAALGGVR